MMLLLHKEESNFKHMFLKCFFSFAIIKSLVGDAMKIKKYRKLNGNKYSVRMDDGEEIKLYDDVIIKYELLRKDEISDELYKEIVKYNNSLDAYYRALKYISIKLRTEKEVVKYLERDYTKEVIDKTVDRLKNDGYLNEEVYLKCYFMDAINLSNKGPNKIKRDLLKLGYEEDVIARNIDTISEEVWKNKIEGIVKKKISSNRNYGNNKLKEKILYDLSNMGYYKWMIEDVIEKAEFGSNDDIIQREYDKLLVKLKKKFSGYELERMLLAKLINKGFSYDDVKQIIEQNKKDI